MEACGCKLWDNRRGKEKKRKEQEYDSDGEGGQCGVSLIISFGPKPTFFEWHLFMIFSLEVAKHGGCF